MAHGDYMCCACCDAKIYYRENASSKEMLCERCAKKISDIVGKPIVSVSQFKELIEGYNNQDSLFSFLNDIGFHFCLYSNSLDQMISEKLGTEYTELIKKNIVLR